MMNFTKRTQRLFQDLQTLLWTYLPLRILEFNSTNPNCLLEVPERFLFAPYPPPSMMNFPLVTIMPASQNQFSNIACWEDVDWKFFISVHDSVRVGEDPNTTFQRSLFLTQMISDVLVEMGNKNFLNVRMVGNDPPIMRPLGELNLFKTTVQVLIQTRQNWEVTGSDLPLFDFLQQSDRFSIYSPLTATDQTTFYPGVSNQVSLGLVLETPNETWVVVNSTKTEILTSVLTLDQPGFWIVLVRDPSLQLIPFYFEVTT